MSRYLADCASPAGSLSLTRQGPMSPEVDTPTPRGGIVSLSHYLIWAGLVGREVAETVIGWADARDRLSLYGTG